MNRLKQIFKNSEIEVKLLWLYVAFLPLMNLPFCTISGKSVLLSDLIAVLLILTVLMKVSLSQYRPSLTYVEYCLIAMLALFSLSLMNSTSMLNSVLEMASLIYLIILFLIIKTIIINKQRLIVILYVWIFAATAVSLIGLTAFSVSVFGKAVTSNPFLTYSLMDSITHHFPRIRSTFLITNMFFSYLHISFIFAAILWMLESDKKNKFLLSVCIFVILMTSFFTGSRRFAGLLLSVFLILSLFGRGKVSSILKYATFSGFLVFFTAYIITSIWVIFPVNVTRDEASKRAGLTADYSYSMHFLSPAVSVKMFKEHPIIGVGLGTYNKRFKEYVDWEWFRSSFGFKTYPEYNKAVEEKTLNFDPHSLFLGVLAETGLLGLSGLLIVIIAYITNVLGRIKKSRNFNFIKIISGCILAGLVGFLLNAITMDVLTMRHFWFMLAIGLTCQKLEESESAA